MIDPQDAADELARRISTERGRYYVPNGGIESVLQLMQAKRKPGQQGTTIFVVEAGNGVGKSVLTVNLASYLTCKYSNPYFDAVDCLREFRRPNRGRIITTATAAQTVYDEELAKWMPLGRYKAKQNGHKFNQQYTSEGSSFDIITQDQDPKQGESVTLDWAICDEPMSRRHFSALKSRFRFGGIIVFVLTPLEGAAWMQHQLLAPERLGLDVFHIRLSSEVNCIQHGVRGLMQHSALEDQWRDYDDDELEARRDGLPLALAGSIYKTFRAGAGGHVMDALPGYYQDCWDRRMVTLWQTIDPHDRKPWFIGWRACFPNGSSFGVAEWPDDSMRPFHKIKSWGWGWKQYAKLTVETESALGFDAYATVADPNYGPSATMTAEGVTSHAAEFQRELSLLRPGKPKRRMIFPPDAISEGHLRVKQALGDPAKGVTPEMYWLSHMRNEIFSMTNYGYAENKNEEKGLSEVPVLQFKDGADISRYFKAAGARYIAPTEQLPDDVDFAEPMRRYSGRVA